MQPYSLLLTKLILAHILSDFILQPTYWVIHRNTHHFKSKFLYVHTFCTALVSWMFMGFQYGWVAMVIFVTHTIIDGGKSFLPKKTIYFIIDQALHLLVLLACWYIVYSNASLLATQWKWLINNEHFWYLLTAFILLSTPSSIFIGECTRQWREKLTDGESLANAGKWIGIIERVLILILVLNDKYEGFGLLVAAKSILRFNEKERPEIKTEYLLIGTFISISLAFFTGLVLKKIW